MIEGFTIMVINYQQEELEGRGMRIYSAEKKRSFYVCFLALTLVSAASGSVAAYICISRKIADQSIPSELRASVMSNIMILLLLVSAAVLSSVCMLINRYRAKHRMREMERAVVEANIRNEAKSDFLSMMSHEIRTPLNSIMGLSSLARRSVDDKEKVTECLGKLDQASDYLLSIVNDILDMAFIESGRLKLSYDRFSLKELIEDVECIYRPIIEEKGQKLSIETDIKDDAVVCDRARLEQVLMNLVSNATKYTQNDGHIKITVKQENLLAGGTGAGGSVYYSGSGENAQKESGRPERAFYSFAVCDDGIGISPEDIQRITAPFEQVRDKRNSEGLKGTGLGLAISRQILFMMGTDINIKSSPGKGSEFSFNVLLQSGSAENEAAPEKDGAFDICGARVLIVDDNEMNAEMLADILETEGAVCRVCSNGKEALNIFLESGTDDASGDRQDSIDVILMDIQMPEMDGLTASAQIRQSGHPDAADVPIIAITAFAFNEDIEKSMEAGMNAHVTKPIHLEEICAIMSDLIKKRNLMRICNENRKRGSFYA